MQTEASPAGAARRKTPGPEEREREAHNVMRTYAPRIWPGWTAHDGLEFFVTFANRTVLILSGRSRVP